MSMDVTEYYRYQAIARGTFTPADVSALVNEYSGMYRKIVRNWLPASLDARVVEVACGPGIFLRWLKKEGFNNVVGSDSSEPQIELALAGEVHALLCDAFEHLDSTPDGTVDCLIAFDFYEHLSKGEFMDFLLAAERILRPGGTLILRGPNGDSPVVGRALYNDITHNFALTTVSFRALLSMFGFSDVDFKDTTLASLKPRQWYLKPLVIMAQQILRVVIRLSTKEDIRILSPSMFIKAKKNESATPWTPTSTNPRTHEN